MKLITVEAKFATANLDAAVALFTAQADAVREMEGCMHYVLFRSSSGDGIAILQHWKTLEQFESYRASEIFSKLGAGLRPLMTTPPVTIVAEVDTV